MSWVDIARRSHPDISEAEILLIEFLEDHDDLRPYTPARDTDWVSKPGIEKAIPWVIEKHRTASSKSAVAAEPKTARDDAVRQILAKFYGYEDEGLAEIIEGHRHAMVAENLAGDLLERYLYDAALRDLGWVWCAGNVVRAVDFVARPKGEWLALQVKSRDNTENSSSVRVRNGTTIEKWARAQSKTGAELWHKFPEASAREILEKQGSQGFLDFIERVAAEGHSP